MSVGEPCWSILASSAEQVEHFFQETIDNRFVYTVQIISPFMDLHWFLCAMSAPECLDLYAL